LGCSRMDITSGAEIISGWVALKKLIPYSK